jgi:hypothetical protein
VLESGGEGGLKSWRLFTHRRRIVLVGRENTPVSAFDWVYSIDALLANRSG